MVFPHNKNLINSQKKSDKKLISKSKSYNELITCVTGVIESVYGKTFQNSYTTNNGVCGPGFNSSTEKTGQSSQLEIKLKDSHDNTNNETTRTLVFDGYVPIQSGQKINAYIFAGQEESLSFLSENKKVLIPRELEKKENILYLEILDKSNKVKDTWDSINYDSKNISQVL